MPRWAAIVFCVIGVVGPPGLVLVAILFESVLNRQQFGMFGGRLKFYLVLLASGVFFIACFNFGWARLQRGGSDNRLHPLEG